MAVIANHLFHHGIKIRLFVFVWARLKFLPVPASDGKSGKASREKAVLLLSGAFETVWTREQTFSALNTIGAAFPAMVRDESLWMDEILCYIYPESFKIKYISISIHGQVIIPK